MTSCRPENPSYYASEAYSHEPWDIMYERWGSSALLSHALKYILRAGNKPSSTMLRDVRCAIAFLKHLEEKLSVAELPLKVLAKVKTRKK